MHVYTMKYRYIYTHTCVTVIETYVSMICIYNIYVLFDIVYTYEIIYTYTHVYDFYISHTKYILIVYICIYDLCIRVYDFKYISQTNHIPIIYTYVYMSCIYVYILLNITYVKYHIC